MLLPLFIVAKVKKEMGEKGIDRHQAMDTVRLQRLVDACDTKENTAFFLLQEWNYEPQVRTPFQSKEKR